MLAREILSPPETWRIIIIDKYVEMDIFQLMFAKSASMKKSVFAFLRHNLHSAQWQVHSINAIIDF